jgi:1-deoxy-D-xylulose 5-phosphate reductoisomerase
VLVVLHTICVSLQGTINSIVYCYDEDILKQCTPSGMKATIVTYASPDKRKTLELQKYQLQHDEEDDTVTRNVDLETSDNLQLQSSIDTLVSVPLQE